MLHSLVVFALFECKKNDGDCKGSVRVRGGAGAFYERHKVSWSTAFYEKQRQRAMVRLTKGSGGNRSGGEYRAQLGSLLVHLQQSSVDAPAQPRHTEGGLPRPLPQCYGYYRAPTPPKQLTLTSFPRPRPNPPLTTCPIAPKTSTLPPPAPCTSRLGHHQTRQRGPGGFNH